MVVPVVGSVTTENDDAGAPTGWVVPTELGSRKSTLVVPSKSVPVIPTGVVSAGHEKVLGGLKKPVTTGGDAWNCQSEIVRAAPQVFGVDDAAAKGPQAAMPSVIVTIA